MKNIVKIEIMVSYHLEICFIDLLCYLLCYNKLVNNL